MPLKSAVDLNAYAGLTDTQCDRKQVLLADVGQCRSAAKVHLQAVQKQV